MARKSPSGVVVRARKPKTPKLARAPAHADYRRLTPDENERQGFTRKARRYVLKTVQKLTKRSQTISARRHETLRAQQEYGLAKPEIATEARQRGALSYKSASAREIAAKGRDSAFKRRLPIEIERSAAKGVRIPEYGKSGRRKGRGSYRVRRKHAPHVADLRQRRLEGEYLDNGDWHLLIDFAEYYGDPKRALLRASPGAYSAKVE
jgi:hypothetical protein